MENSKKEFLKSVLCGDIVASIERGECPSCSEPVDVSSFKDAESREEFNISGMCQECQDVLFSEEEILIEEDTYCCNRLEDSEDDCCGGDCCKDDCCGEDCCEGGCNCEKDEDHN